MDPLPPEPHDVPLRMSTVDTAQQNEPSRQQADAAVHLANERTFLAWSFTAIVIIGCGVALARTLIALNASFISARPGGAVSPVFYPTTMGLLFIGSGLLIMVMASCRYLSVEKQIIEQRYRPCSTLPLLLLTTILALSIVLAGFLLQMRGIF